MNAVWRSTARRHSSFPALIFSKLYRRYFPLPWGSLGAYQEDKAAARQKAALVSEKLRAMKLERIASFVETSVDETLSYMDFPYEHWSRLRTNNGLERIMKEIRRRTRVVGSFPDGYSAMMLVGARLRHISTTKWGTRQYMNTCKLYEGGIR